MKKITFLVACLLASVAVNAQAFTEDFEGEVVDATTFTNWDNIDEDGDGEFWEVADMEGYAPAHPMQSLVADSDSWEGTAFSPDNYLITSEPIDLTSYSGTSITYTVGTYQTNGTFISDKYSIYMATGNGVGDFLNETPIVTKLVGDDCPSDEEDGSASAATLTVDASAYDGQVVYLCFRHYDTTDENSVLIDDIIVDGTLSVGEEIFNGFNYFVDNNSQLQLRANNVMSEVALYNLLGQQVIVNKLNDTNAAVNMANLTSGVYIATVSIDGQNKSFKIVKR